MNRTIAKENEQVWFVMLCNDIKHVESYLNEYRGIYIDAVDRIADYFIPAEVIKRRMPGRYAAETSPNEEEDKHVEDRDLASNSIREEIASFVFLLTRPSALKVINSQYWNSGRTRLRHYRDKNGDEIYVREDKMKLFITTCITYREQFELRPDEDTLKEGMMVTVSRGPLKNLRALIYNIRFKGDGIRFSMSVRFFENGKDIKIHNRTPDDVILDDQHSIVFSDDFIDHVENRLLLMLSRRVNRKETEESRMADRQQLEELRYFQYVKVDNPTLSARLDALMSIRASLGADQQNKAKYNRIVKQRIRDIKQYTPEEYDADTYLSLGYQLAALCISTADPVCRDELKAVVRNHLQDNKNIRRYLSLIRRMQMRKN